MIKFLPLFLVGLIVLTSFILMLTASFQESAIMDELAHIPAGYGYVKYLDYRLNPEHPPLIKAIAAFPLLFQNLNFPIIDIGEMSVAKVMDEIQQATTSKDIKLIIEPIGEAIKSFNFLKKF